MNWKAFCKVFCKKSWKNNNTWNIRRLVDDSFVPSSQRPSVIYQRLTDFRKQKDIHNLDWGEIWMILLIGFIEQVYLIFIQVVLKMLGFINHISMKYGWFLVKMYDWKCEFISFLRRHNCLQLFGCYQSHQIYLKRISICLDIHVCEFVPLDYFAVFQCIWLLLPLLRPERNGRL